MKGKLLRYGLALLLSLGLMGCSEDNDVASHGDDIVWGDNPDGMPEGGWTAALMPAMATNLEVPYKGSVKLKVSLISLDDKSMGEGLYGERIKWWIESGEDLITLPSMNSLTGDNGISTMTIDAGMVPGEAMVVASSPKAPKTVRFLLNVLPKPIGSLRVNLHYNGFAPIVNHSIRVYDGKEVQCAFVDLKTGVDDTIQPLAVINSDTALVENLPAEQRYSVVAYGFAANGAPVATGCLDSGINIIPNDIAEANLYLDTIELDPTTNYHVRSLFDLGDLASALGSYGAVIVKVTDFADNPGKMLYDQIWELLSTWIGGLGTAAKVAIGAAGLDETAINWLNGKLQESETVCNVGIVACQLRNFIRMMEFMGELDIQREGSIVLNGHNTYNGLAVYWRVGCNGKDPNCGRMPVTMSDVGLGDNKFLEGSWEGSLSNGYNKISIENHELYLDYGKIAIYLIEKVLLPRLANGATNFSDAMASWINCNSIGKWLNDTIDDIPAVSGPGVTKTTNWCKSAVNGLVKVLNFATAVAELKKSNAVINISGTAFLEDSNADNIVDEINSGNWAGSMTIKTTDESGASVSASTGVKGIWSAYNMNNIIVGSLMYCSYPKTSTDSPDQKCSYPPIDSNELFQTTMCNLYEHCGTL